MGIGVNGTSLSIKLDASVLLKPPLVATCEKSGLKKCDDLVEGLLLYASGSQDAGLQKATVAAAANKPQQLEQFFLAAKVVALTVPPAKAYVEPIVRVGDKILAENKRSDEKVQVSIGPERVAEPPLTIASLPSEAPVQPKAAPVPALLVREGTFDSSAYLGGTLRPVKDPRRVPCSNVFGSDLGSCVRIQDGPFFLTDLMVPQECGGELFAISARASGSGVRWMAPLGRTNTHGARLFVRPTETLFLAVVPGPKSNGEDCSITWSGFRPSSSWQAN